MNWISTDELFDHIPRATHQHKALLCLSGTAWIVYGAITVFYNDPVVVTYSEFVDGGLVLTEYIPTHFILVPEKPNGFPKLIRQEG
jgi:hypothetical protein